jgi:hypothetical protein
MNILTESLKFCVGSIRKFKYLSLNAITNELINVLQDLKAVNYYEDHARDQIIFALPLQV